MAGGPHDRASVGKRTGQTANFSKFIVYNNCSYMIKPSTFSIVAYDRITQSWGVAVASKFPAVGAVVPWAAAGQGAVATQSFANTSFGPKGLALMAGGATADQTLEALKAGDPDIESRQFGLVDKKGGSATFTGSGCFDWAGGIAGHGFAVQGNILAGAAVVQAMAHTFQSHNGEFQARLLAALQAGDDAGGDKRGKQSAAILVVREKGGYAGFNDRALDYRVDDDPQPISKLWSLLEIHDLLFSHSTDDKKLPIRGEVREQLARVLVAAGHLDSPDSANFTTALNHFIGRENFEDRCDTNLMTIDEPVLDYLVRRYLK